LFDAVRVDEAAPERVDAAPSTANVEQFDLTERLRNRRIDDEVYTGCLQTEHGSEEQQRRAG